MRCQLTYLILCQLPIPFQSMLFFMNCPLVQFQSASLLMNCLPAQCQSETLLIRFLCSVFYAPSAPSWWYSIPLWWSSAPSAPPWRSSACLPICSALVGSCSVCSAMVGSCSICSGGLLFHLLRPSGLQFCLLHPGRFLLCRLRPGLQLRSGFLLLLCWFCPCCLLSLGALLCRLCLSPWPLHFHVDLATCSASAPPPS